MTHKVGDVVEFWYKDERHLARDIWTLYLGILGTVSRDIGHRTLGYLARYLRIFGTIPWDNGHNTFGYWAQCLRILSNIPWDIGG